ncbi:MAG: hypothetical protein HYV28_15165 [Ignavibacteriales bacterium]|nr:hypothetical protein [Ignavibacteriales bacterium]
MRKLKKTIYRFFDDHEEKHYVLCSLDHKVLEALIEKYKSRKDKVYAKDFVTYLKRHDKEAEEVIVKDFYF